MGTGYNKNQTQVNMLFASEEFFEAHIRKYDFPLEVSRYTEY